MEAGLGSPAHLCEEPQQGIDEAFSERIIVIGRAGLLLLVHSGTSGVPILPKLDPWRDPRPQDNDSMIHKAATIGVKRVVNKELNPLPGPLGPIFLKQACPCLTLWVHWKPLSSGHHYTVLQLTSPIILLPWIILDHPLMH